MEGNNKSRGVSNMIVPSLEGSENAVSCGQQSFTPIILYHYVESSSAAATAAVAESMSCECSVSLNSFNDQ